MGVVWVKSERGGGRKRLLAGPGRMKKGGGGRPRQGTREQRANGMGGMLAAPAPLFGPQVETFKVVYATSESRLWLCVGGASCTEHTVLRAGAYFWQIVSFNSH
jgi:hypothetical protein